MVSQPAISKAIVKLEEKLGVRLFHRNSRGVSLTPEGEILFARVGEAFEHIECGEEEIRKLREFNIGHLHIGSSTTLCKYLLIPYLREFMKQYPHMKISITNQDSSRTMKEVEEGRIDVGAVVLSDLRGANHFFKIMDVEDIFVCTPDYLENLKLVEDGDLDIFKTANVLLLDKGNITRRYIDEYFKEQDIVPSRTTEATTMDLLIDFAKIGLGVAAVIKEFVLSELREGTLIQVPLSTPVKKRVAGFAYLGSNDNDALKKFLLSVS